MMNKPGKINTACQSSSALAFSIKDAEILYKKRIANAVIRDIEDPGNFVLNVRNINFNKCSVVETNFNRKCLMEAPLSKADLKFVVGSKIPATFNLENRPVRVSDSNGLLMSSESILQVEREAFANTVVANIPMQELINHYQSQINQSITGSIVFSREIDLRRGPGRLLKTFLLTYVSEIMNDKEILSIHRFSRGVEEFILNSILSLPHQIQGPSFNSPVKPTYCQDVVKTSEEYMREHYRDPIQVTDLLKATSCSRKVLYSSFQKHRDYSPMAFLLNQRLEVARQALIDAEQSGHSVSEIAFSSGFSHLGRFSKVYKEKYGELPSETIRGIS